MSNPRLLVLASGTATGGGSGFECLVKGRRDGVLSADIVGVASHHANGGVAERAERLNIPFYHRTGPWTPAMYQELVAYTRADFVQSSGWVWPIRGLPPARTSNIHPALPPFIGKRMFGKGVRKAVIEAFRRGEIIEDGFVMHFVTDFDDDGDYDRGPEFFRFILPIFDEDTADSLGERKNSFEHEWQAPITDLLVTEQIRWSGERGRPVLFPLWYRREVRLGD